MSDQKTYVEKLNLAEEIERRIAFASVRLGDVLIRGITVWRSPRGQLRVYFPSYRLERGFDDVIHLPEELQTQVEADVVAAYKEAVSRAKETREIRSEYPSMKRTSTPTDKNNSQGEQR